MRQATRGVVFQAGTSGNHFDISSPAAPRAAILQQTDNTRNALGRISAPLDKPFFCGTSPLAGVAVTVFRYLIFADSPFKYYPPLNSGKCGRVDQGSWCVVVDHRSNECVEIVPELWRFTEKALQACLSFIRRSARGLYEGKERCVAIHRKIRVTTMAHTNSTKVLTTSLESGNNEVYDHTFLFSPAQRPSPQTSSLTLGLLHLSLTSRKCMEDQ